MYHVTVGIKWNQTALPLGLVRQIICGLGLTQFANVRRKACNLVFKLISTLVSCDSNFCYDKTNIRTTDNVILYRVLSWYMHFISQLFGWSWK